MGPEVTDLVALLRFLSRESSSPFPGVLNPLRFRNRNHCLAEEL